jgi:hypothetical protein
MQTRTRHFVAHFAAPFTLANFAERQPAGPYALDQHEEFVAGSAAYQRVAMFMHLPTIASGRWTLQSVPVEPAEIGAAILQEAKQQPPS